MTELYHSSKGTHWKKEKDIGYYKKIGKRYYYTYEKIYKALWKLKNKEKKESATSKVVTNSVKAESASRYADKYDELASKYEAAGNTKKAKELREEAKAYRTKSSAYTNIANHEKETVTNSLISKGQALLKRR